VERNYDLEKRKYVIGGAVIVIVLIFLIRLLSLQIMSEDYKKNADSNAFLKKIQYPSRGVIYDRNDKLLVYNQAAYDITVIMKEITELDTMDLCQTLKISSEFLRKKFRDMKNRRLNPGYSPYTNQVFLTQLSAEDLVFNLEYILYANVFVSISKAGYHYVQNPQSICHTQINLASIVQNKLQVFRYYKELYTKLGLYDQVQPQLYKFLTAFSENAYPSGSPQKIIMDMANHWGFGVLDASDKEKKHKTEPDA
jgi:penicillin-binding protein 2